MTEEINKGCEFQSDCIEYKDISYLKIMPICAIHELSIACHDKVNKCKYYKLYKQLKRLEFELKITKADYEASEQENKELKEWKERVVKLFESACRCKYLNEETDICSYTNEKCININKCVYKYQELSSNYRSALEEIRDNFMLFRSCMIPFHVGSKETLPHNMADAIQNYCESIINKINEVLG